MTSEDKVLTRIDKNKSKLTDFVKNDDLVRIVKKFVSFLVVAMQWFTSTVISSCVGVDQLTRNPRFGGSNPIATVAWMRKKSGEKYFRKSVQIFVTGSVSDFLM